MRQPWRAGRKSPAESIVLTVIFLLCTILFSVVLCIILEQCYTEKAQGTTQAGTACHRFHYITPTITPCPCEAKRRLCKTGNEEDAVFLLIFHPYGTLYTSRQSTTQQKNYFNAACAAARRAMGTRKGEQLT
jgi:hypothetical protein